jgi:uncharacterized protein YerC
MVQQGHFTCLLFRFSFELQVVMSREGYTMKNLRTLVEDLQKVVMSREGYTYTSFWIRFGTSVSSATFIGHCVRKR